MEPLSAHGILELRPAGVQYVEAGAAVQLLCVLLNISLVNPESIHWRFNRDGTDSLPDSRHLLRPFTERVAYEALSLRLTEMRHELSGVFTCSVDLRKRRRAPNRNESLSPSPAAVSATVRLVAVEPTATDFPESSMTPPSLPRAPPLLVSPPKLPERRLTFAEFLRPSWRRLVVGSGATCLAALAILACSVALCHRHRQRLQLMRRESPLPSTEDSGAIPGSTTAGGCQVTSSLPAGVAILSGSSSMSYPNTPLQQPHLLHGLLLQHGGNHAPVTVAPGADLCWSPPPWSRQQHHQHHQCHLCESPRWQRFSPPTVSSSVNTPGTEQQIFCSALSSPIASVRVPPYSREFRL